MKHYQRLATVFGSIALAACAQAPGYGTAAPQGGYGQQAPASTGTMLEQALINILMQQMGISSQQAMGGVGSIFAVAQQRMSPNDFARLSSAVPGMSQYLSAAVPPQASTSGTGALLSAAGAALGGQNSTLGSLASLAGSFQSLGMDASMIGKFVPVMLQYVQQQGGSGTMSLLQNALR